MSDCEAEHPAHPPDDLYRCLCRSSAAALIATDAGFNVVFWNAAASQMLGPDPDEMLGRPLESVVPENRRKLFHRLLQRTSRRGEDTQFEIRLPAGNGTRDLLVAMSPIPGPNHDAPRGVAAWIVDETRQRRTDERLAQAEKMASLGTLAGGVAHHFNNILGGVATFVDYALTSGDNAAMRRALQMTAEAAARASKITQSLLSFAEQDTHRTDLADLTEVLLTFAHLVERPLSERRIGLNLDIKPVPITAVEANRMHQVLGNLLTNAEEAMPEGGQITLSLAQEDDAVVLRFSDTGEGINPENLPMVFEPFFTTKGLLAGGEKGNPGLGLSVAHGIVVEMGGSIRAESEGESGATFVISFPVRSQDEVPEH